MILNRFLSFSIAPSCLLLGAALHAQGTSNPNQENDLYLSNGAEQHVLYSDPSVGFPTGTFPPDTDGDWYWTVVPREVLNHPDGTMEISGIHLELMDVGNFAWPTNYYDLLFSAGIDNPAFPGNVRPNFFDPNLVFLSLGPTGIPNPCETFPQFCQPQSPTGCPPPTADVVWVADIQIGTGPGTGIVVPADGTVDYTVTSFVPGGLSTAPQTPCPYGSYVMPSGRSTDEVQVDWLGTGYSAYGGTHLAGGVATPDPVNETVIDRLQFVEPTVTFVVGPTGTAFRDPGLGAVHVPLSSAGSIDVSVRHHALQAANDGDAAALDLAFCAGSVKPLLNPPGVSILGANILLDPFNGVFNYTAQFWSGTYLFQDNGGDPLDNVMFESAVIPVNSALVGSDLHCQCAWYDAVLAMATESNVATAHLY